MNLNETLALGNPFTSKTSLTTRDSSPTNKPPVHLNTTAHRIYAPCVAFAYAGSAPRFATPTRGRIDTPQSQSSHLLLDGKVPSVGS